ncbi:histidine utilization repressor [Sodalis sp. RH20]|uniref:histidine utilization repressor n=1 Tax=unclassified Sodalis (in: enterobacteria) TaxID=2636512 RepID=UPI0039B5762C
MSKNESPLHQAPPAHAEPSPLIPKRSRVKPLPIHQGIQNDIKNKILSNEWHPGDRVPTEQELMAVYQCSRMTVNKALSTLVAAGMIVRKRRKGSFVAMPRVDEPLLAIQDIRAEVLASDSMYSFSLLSRGIRTITDAVEAEHIGIPVNARMLCIDVMHYADNLPFALEARQINLAVVPEAAQEEFIEMPPGSWLLSNIPWSEGEHSLRAISADDVLARQLSVSPGTACISIARRTWLSGELITFVRLIYPGERHRFLVRFGPSPANLQRDTPNPG